MHYKFWQACVTNWGSFVLLQNVRVQSRDNSAKSYQYSIFKVFTLLIDSSTLFQLMFSISALMHYQLLTQLKFYYRLQMN